MLIAPPKAKRPSTLNNGPPKNPIGASSVIHTSSPSPKISKVEIDLMALEYTELRAVSAANQGNVPGTEVNLLKIRGSEMQQKISELLVEAIGYYANPFVPDSFQSGCNEESIGPDYAATLAPEYFNWRKSSIYAGSNEIQKNIISKMVLGL